MAKIQMSESELKQIIRESVESAINENGGFMYTPPAAQAGNDRIGPGPSLTRTQVDTKNATANAALTSWNNLGTLGQIKTIQKLVGATPDGKLGPETLGKIYVALRKGQSGLENVNFRPGRAGTYTNI